MAITVYTEDVPHLVDDISKYSKNYEVIKAAGGAVYNDEKKMLLIYRRGKWDLPKGKLEGNEPIELCADREVKEETGLNDLSLIKPLIVTYHTYLEKGKSILKETHWFLFNAPGKQDVHPQTEEDILKVIWADKEELKDYKVKTYQLIRDVLHSAGF